MVIVEVDQDGGEAQRLLAAVSSRSSSPRPLREGGDEVEGGKAMPFVTPLIPRVLVDTIQ